MKWDLFGCPDLLSQDKAVFMQTDLNEFVDGSRTLVLGPLSPE